MGISLESSVQGPRSPGTPSSEDSNQSEIGCQHDALPQLPSISRVDSSSDAEGTGSGFGGWRTPTDDFLARRRKCSWQKDPAERRPAKPFPPRVYVDNKTLIREVTDPCTLRRGDHCMIAINLFRCASPALDYLISCLGSIELCYFYHHFIMVDDVDHVDELGVPRTRTGELAMIVEYANTVPEALEEVKSNTIRSGLLRAPTTILTFIFRHKAKCTLHPLADYGDTPHIYTVVEKLTPEERERIALNAQDLAQQPKQYHVLFHNCEHACLEIYQGASKSPMVHFAGWVFFRVCLGMLGILILRMNEDIITFAGTCYSRFLPSYPNHAMVAYHILACLPVMLQALISYILLIRNVWRQHKLKVIDRADCYHLTVKEFTRAIVVGGSTFLVMVFAPCGFTGKGTQGFAQACVLCAFAFTASDVFYNCLAHAVMRLVLLPNYGRVWLHWLDKED